MKKRPVPQYTGPRMASVNKLDDHMVLLELNRLGQELHPPYPLFYDNYGPIDDGDARATPTHWTPEQLNEAHTKHEAWCRSLLRSQLFTAYIEAWVIGLSERDRWAIIEAGSDGEENSLKDSEKRSTAKAEVIRKATHLILSQLNKEEHGKEQTRTPATPHTKKIQVPASSEL